MTPKEIGRAADRIFQNVLPPSLVIRDQQDQEDYGIDYEIEVMLPGDRASGVIFKVQQKGPTDLKVNAAGDQISFFGLEIERMRYYLHDLRIPAALVVVDVQKRDVYWVRLQGNTEAEAAYRQAALANQDSLTVLLPTQNKIPNTLDAFLTEMARGQDAVMLRYLRDISSNQVLEAARSLPNFDATVRAARAHADILRLEQVERMWRGGDLPSAFAECRRVWASESETIEARLAAGLNLIRFDGPMQGPQRTVEQENAQLQRRLAVTGGMCRLVGSRTADDRLRLFAEFQDHIAKISALTSQFAGLLSVPTQGSGGAGLVSSITEMAKRRIVIEVLANFQEAYDRFTAFIRGGHIELIAQAWAMLTADTLIFVQLARENGYGTLADGLTGWFDQTLPVAVQFAEGMQDWTSVAFCALQQIPLAPLENAGVIARRAEVARGYIRRLPVAEQQQHLDEVERRVQALRVAPPVPTVEMEQEVARMMLLAMGGSLGEDTDSVSQAVNLAIRDMNPDRALRTCQSLFLFLGNASPLGRMLNLPTLGDKWLYCTKHGHRLGSVSLDTAFAGFKSEYCDNCPDRTPHPDAWKWTPEWHAGQD